MQHTKSLRTAWWSARCSQFYQPKALYQTIQPLTFIFRNCSLSGNHSRPTNTCQRQLKIAASYFFIALNTRLSIQPWRWFRERLSPFPIFSILPHHDTNWCSSFYNMICGCTIFFRLFEECVRPWGYLQLIVFCGVKYIYDLLSIISDCHIDLAIYAKLH